MLEVGQFVTVKSSRYLDYGVKKGDLMYLAGDTVVHVGDDYPYAMRKLFIAAFVKDGHVDAVSKPLTMDGINLRAVSKTKQEKLYAQLEADFAEEGDSSSA